MAAATPVTNPSTLLPLGELIFLIYWLLTFLHADFVLNSYLKSYGFKVIIKNKFAFHG